MTAEILDHNVGAQPLAVDPRVSDPNGGVTTGLLTAVGYLKDNRLLPRGFDTKTAEPDIAVRGDATEDGDFVGGRDQIRYSVPIAAASGPFQITARLLYEPIAYRWANNLKSYNNAPEPLRFTSYYDAMAAGSAATLASAEASVR